MGKAVSPAVGFNDNVRRRNRNFHVQTEDSGVAHPHIITHLFTDGGRIVKSMRQSYADIVAEENLAKRVRERMKAQHVSMLEALKSGEFDALVWGSRAPGKPKPATAPTQPVVAPAPVSQAAPSSNEPSSSQPSSSLLLGRRQESAPVSSTQVSSPQVPVEVQSAPIEAPLEAAGTGAAARLPTPPQRRSNPPLARKPPQPPARKTMPRIDATVAPVATGAAAAPSVGTVRARKSVPPKVRRTSRPPPRSISRPAVANPRDGLVSQTLDEVILRMLSEEQDSKSGS